MKYEDFNEFFSSIDADNNEVISKWEELSKRKRKVSIIVVIILLIIDALILYKIRTFSLFVIMPIFIIDIFIYIISQIATNGEDIEQFNNDYKEKFVNKMLENFIEELDYIPLKSLSRNVFDEAKYGGSYNKYYSDDYFEGKINNQKIVMADLNVQEEIKKKDKDGNETTETTTIFNGLFGKINLSKSINTTIYVTREYGFFDEQKLEMDSYEFEKAFSVYAENKITAMQLLTSDVQEDILELYNKYKIDFNIIIRNDKMYVLFETGSMFEIFSTRNNPNEVLEEYFEIMKFIYKLVDKILKTIDSTQI